MLGIVLTPIWKLLHVILGVSTAQNFPPPLDTRDEEETFRVARMGEAQERFDARQKLILHNLRLVSHIVRKYYATANNQEDLVSIGTIGLVKAVDTFKIDNGARFATYAAKCIQNEILMHFRSRKKLSWEVSISETIDTDKDGAPLTYSDIISVDDTIAEDLDRKLQGRRVVEIVNRILEPREREIIVLRYGLGGKKPITQRETADVLGISRSYVSRIEKAALEKIAKNLERMPL